LARVDDRDLPDRVRQVVGHPSDHRHSVADLDDDRAKVEDDFSAFFGLELRLVVQQAHQLALRRSRRRHPNTLDTRPLERRDRRPIRARARKTGQNGSQPFLCGGQPSRDSRLHVDV
jgi:hypothetical protein